MDVGAKETEDGLKKELTEVKNQVTTLKERTAEVRRGECPPLRGGAVCRNRLAGALLNLFI
jgi:hypothetical protein